MGKAMTDTFYPRTVIEGYYTSTLSDGMYSNVIDMFNGMYDFCNKIRLNEGIECRIICSDDPSRLTIGYTIYYEKDGVHSESFSMSISTIRSYPRLYELLSTSNGRVWVCNYWNLRSIVLNPSIFFYSNNN